MKADVDRIECILEAAVELPSAAERREFIERACAGDAQLKQRVEEMVENHFLAGSFLEAPVINRIESIADTIGERCGTTIGPYKLLEQIGEGGFGVVYMAEQIQPMRRKVALKIIKPGMDTRQVIARFDAERQALALMDHPNIAKVLDGGTTGDRPFFVMELVKGIPITEFCDQNRLTPRQRLELFVPVCQAIQHAHQKGIIHRDLKPSNVLIALYDDKPVPKVIDFGVAKAIGQQLTEQTLNTSFGAVVGTIEYMSPEQASFNQLDVDTRSDIYSLGVLLYELLTGTTPLEHQRVKEAGFLEALRIIREVESPTLSNRLSTTDALPAIAAKRDMEPARLTRLVRGELDWIVMKALEKDRNRRYESASDLAADLQRYLHDEPVQACPPSVGYRLRKFWRRNKGPVVAGLLVLLALLGGIVGTSWGLVRAYQASLDEAKRAEGEQRAKELAQKREGETEKVLQFVVSRIFAAARPKGQAGGLGRDVPLQKAIEAAVPFVDENFPNEPLIEARLRLTLGMSFWYLGDGKRSAEQCEKACALYRQHLGPDDPNTLKCMSMLAVGYDMLGRYTKALELREEVLDRRRKLLGPEHADTVSSMHNLAISYETTGQNAKALKLRKETLELDLAQRGPNDPETLRSMSNLANSYAAVGQYEDARKLQEEVLKRRQAILEPDHPDTLLSMNNLANTYASLDRHDEALKLRIETLEKQKNRLGPTHPHTLISMTNLANSLSVADRHSEALKLRQETLNLRRAEDGHRHPATARSMYSLALSYADLGKYDKALEMHRETLALRKEILTENHPEILASMREVAICLIKLKRGAEAIALIDDGIARAARSVGDPSLTPALIKLRIEHFVLNKDAAGCRATAQMWEDRIPRDAASLALAGRLRAATAAAVRQDPRTPPGDVTRLVTDEADKAMHWLKAAVAAGYADSDHLRTEPDFASLREREDFKQLLVEIEKRKK